MQVNISTDNHGFPLTAAQLDIYLDQARYSDSPIYNIGGYVRIDKKVNVAVFEQAFDQLVASNDVFHLGFHHIDEQIIQKYKATPAKFSYLEFDQQSDPAKAARSWVDEQLQLVFDLTEHGLYHSYLLKINDEEYWYVPIAHHLITDGFGYSNWIDTLLRIYLSIETKDHTILSDRLTQFADVAKKEGKYLTSNSFIKSAEFWDKTFEQGLLPVLSRRGSITETNKSSFVVTKDLSQKEYRRLIDLSTSLGCRVHHLFLAALYSYFFSIQDNDRFTIGLPFHNRTGGSKKSIGCFTSVSPLLTCGSQNMAFCELMTLIQENMRAMSKHKKYPLSIMFQKIREQQPDIERLFDIQFNYQKLNYTYADDKLNTTTYFLPPGHEQIPFIFNLCEFGEQQDVQLQVEANYSFFEPNEAKLVLERLLYILDQVVIQPDIALKNLQLATAADTSAYNQLKNDIKLNIPLVPVSELFNKQVFENPDNTALISADTKLSYQQLQQNSFKVANYLKEQGIEKGDRVAICLPREADLITLLLACLTIGATYVPLDPKYPLERLQYMIEDSSVKILIIGSDIKERLNLTAPETLIWDKEVNHQISLMEVKSLKSDLGDLNSLPAYIIYTSGSTGKPKGVVISQAGLANFLIGITERLDLGVNSHWLATTTIGFDIATMEIYGPLISGGKLTLLDSETSQHGEKLKAILEKSSSNIIQCTPAMWQMLLDAGWTGNSELLAVSGGEALSEVLADKILSRCNRLFNAYGPTEASVYSLLKEVLKDSQGKIDCNLGDPLPNYRHYIIDSRNQIAPIGVAGELCIAGIGLAIGYLNQAELTAKQFINYQGLQNNERIYRTGDLVRLLPSGQVEFLGRLDHQVKIRGYRIELGEVESQLQLHSEINDVVVVARDNAQGEKILVAYLISTVKHDNDELFLSLREYLSDKLPNFMLPQAFVRMEDFPLTSNGKVDRKALPAPDYKSKKQFIVAESLTEKSLVNIWQELFDIQVISTGDNFFELGGHSLMAMRMFGHIKRAYKVELPLTIIFSHSDIRSLAAHLDDLIKEQKLGTDVIELNPLKNIERYPLSTAQKSMWMMDKLSNGAVQYNMPGVFSIIGLLQPSALSIALEGLVERHQVLRTMLVEHNDDIYQQVFTNHKFEMPLEDLSEHKGDPQTQVQQLVEQEANTVFELSRDLKLRAKLIKLADDHHILLLTLHHIAADGWSINVLSKELMALYHSALTGVEAELPDLKVQYKDYAHWQQQRLNKGLLDKQLNYWSKQLKDSPKTHNLALDFPRPATQSFEGEQIQRRLSKKTTDKINSFAKPHQVTTFMILQTVFATMLSQWSREEDILMGTAVAGRQHPDVEPLIGCFTNSLVLRSDVSKGDNFISLLSKSRTMILEAFENQDAPFEKLVEQLQPERNASYNPVFQIWIVLHNHEQQALCLSGLEVEQELQDSLSVKFDLALSITEVNDELVLEWQYCNELFLQETINNIATSFEVLLEGLLQCPDVDVQKLPLLAKETSENPFHSIEVQRYYPENNNLIGLFESQAALKPDATALVYQDQSISYFDLNIKANRLAQRLISQGVKENTPVGLCVDRSIGMLIGLLGILKSGGAYVPLDPSAPAERLAYIVSDTQLNAIVTNQAHRMLIPEMITEVTLLDEVQLDTWLGDFSPEPPLINKESENLAYILYTSGSTGKPKGVAVTHKNLLNLTYSMREILADRGLKEDYRWAWSAPMVFDASVQALTQLAFGVELHLLSEEHRKSPVKLLNYLKSSNILLLDSTPSLVELLLKEADIRNQALPNLLIGGEAINPLLWNSLSTFQTKHNRFSLNVYGPTECTVNASFADIDDNQSVNIGLGLANVRLYVMDDKLQVLPKGTTGELYIGGAGVAKGYYRNEELTCKYFIDSDCYGRLYKTGDLARWRNDGQLEYLGRNDFQVKLRGYRIELEEIELVLLDLEEVSESVVLLKEDQLIAYVVAQGCSEAVLMARMKSHLPAYMVASKIVMLEKIPLTKNGKQDRNALFALDIAKVPCRYTAPETEIERQLQKIWQKLLNLDAISVEANFFEIGGHSLLAIRLASACREHFNTELPLSEFMASPSIRALAQNINQIFHNKNVFAHVENDEANLDKNERIVI